MKKSLSFMICLSMALIISISSCKKEDKVLPAPEISFSIAQDTLYSKMNEAVKITASVKGKVSANHQWTVGEEVVSTDTVFNFTPKLPGEYKITYIGSNPSGSVTKVFYLVVEVPVRPVTPQSSAYISKIFEYLPAPGQFINKNIGDLASAEKLIGGASSMVSLGAYGGYIVFGFDHSIVNKEGNDLAVYGNPGKAPYDWAEPGIVMVSQDANANGLPDDPWYELAGSEYNSPETIKNYKITYYNPKEAGKDIPWKDNKGRADVVLANNFHKQNYYPLFVSNQDSISFTGTLLKNTFGKNDGIFINGGFDWGYTDTWSTVDNYDAKRYNSFDISHAVNGEGKKVTLKAIDFVKVYTGQNHQGNTMMGEVSTEVKGAADISMLP